MPRTKSTPRKYTSKRSGSSRRLSYSRMGKTIFARRFSTVADVPDSAACSVSGGVANPGVNQTYQVNNLELANYPRAVQIARAYQLYRIKKVTLHFRPLYDTFAAAGTSSKMNLYYMIDKAGAIPANIGLVALKQMGAKPHALDEKPVSVSWAPSVLDSVLVAGAAAQQNYAGQYTISPWLSTNNFVEGAPAWGASNVDHLGITFYVEQLLTPVQTQYELDIECQIEFKKPLWPVNQGEEGDTLITLSTGTAPTPTNTPLLRSIGGMFIGAGAGE